MWQLTSTSLWLAYDGIFTVVLLQRNNIMYYSLPVQPALSNMSDEEQTVTPLKLSVSRNASLAYEFLTYTVYCNEASSVLQAIDSLIDWLTCRRQLLLIVRYVAVSHWCSANSLLASASYELCARVTWWSDLAIGLCAFALYLAQRQIASVFVQSSLGREGAGT